MNKDTANHKESLSDSSSSIEKERLKRETNPYNPVWKSILGYDSMEASIYLTLDDKFKEAFLIKCKKRLMRPKKREADEVKVHMILVQPWILHNWSEFQKILEDKKFNRVFKNIMALLSPPRSIEIERLIENKKNAPLVSIFPALNTGRVEVKGNIEFLFKYSDQELAIFITNIEVACFKAIENRELYSGLWTKPNSKELAPGVTTMINFGNYLTDLVHTSILSYEGVVDRVHIILRWVGIANTCKKERNYSTAITIIFALNNPVIDRLHKTREQLRTLHPQHYDLLISLSQKFSISSLMTMYGKFQKKSIKNPRLLVSICIVAKKIATTLEMIKDNISIGFIDLDKRKILNESMLFVNQCQDHCDLIYQEEDITFSIKELFFNFNLFDEDQKYTQSRKFEAPTAQTPIELPPAHPFRLMDALNEVKEAINRKSREIKLKLMRPSIQEAKATPTPPNSDRENQIPTPRRSVKKILRFNTNAPESPRLVTSGSAKADRPILTPLSTPPVSPRETQTKQQDRTPILTPLSSPLISPRYAQQKRKSIRHTLTQRAVIQSPRSEAPSLETLIPLKERPVE